MPEQRIVKMVLTGGPCGGKTTLLTNIQEELPKFGWYVIVIPETATALITSGITPWNAPKALDFQRVQLQLQINKEQAAEIYANSLPNPKILIVCDRGTMDVKAYLPAADFATLLDELQTSEVSLRDRYDFVIHLETAAKGAEQAYTLSNNTARTETPAEARAADNKTVTAWIGHPHLRVIGNKGDFAFKVRRALAEIHSALGEPQPMEIERKYLIRMPNLDQLVEKYHAEPIDIVQTYLQTSQPDTEVRIRQRGTGDQFVYFLTEKLPVTNSHPSDPNLGNLTDSSFSSHKVTGISRIERERQITDREYLSLLMNADPLARPIRKTRYCFPYDEQYIELDVFPAWQNQAVVEVELSDEDQAVNLPPELDIIAEVTGDPTYTNFHFAHHDLPQEI